MTREQFTKVYDCISSNLKSEVNGDPCWEYLCELIDHCGGYKLTMTPQALTWGKEIAFMNAVCEANCVSLAVYFSRGTIEIM